MYGNNRRAGPLPGPAPKPVAPQPKPSMGHYWPWWDDYYVWDHDYYYHDYDDWYDWVWTSAYEKGLGEGRKQGFAHAVNLANEGAPAPKPVAPTPAPAPMPEANVVPHVGNVYPHTTALGI